MKKIAMINLFATFTFCAFSNVNNYADSSSYRTKLKNLFSLSIGANYNIYSTEFKTPTIRNMGYSFETGYNSANILLDIKLSTPFGEFRRKISENTYRDVNGDPMVYNVMSRSGLANFKHSVFQYVPLGLTNGLSLIFRYKDKKRDPIRSMFFDMLFPDYLHENIESLNLSLTRTEMFGFYGVMGYSNVKFSNLNTLNQKIEGQLLKFYFISLTNVVRRSWTDQILFTNTIIAKQNGSNHKIFLTELNESYSSFFHRLIPLPMVDLYMLNEKIKITDSNGSIIYSSPKASGSLGYNVGIGWLNYIAIPKIRTLIIPSFYYYFIDMAFESKEQGHTNLIEQKRYNISLSMQLCF